MRACNCELESQATRQWEREVRLICPQTVAHARVIVDDRFEGGQVFAEKPGVLHSRCRREFATKQVADRVAACQAVPRLCVGDEAK